MEFLKSEIDIEALHTKAPDALRRLQPAAQRRKRAVTVRGFAADILPFIAAGKIGPLSTAFSPSPNFPQRRPTWNRTRTSGRSRSARENRGQTTVFSSVPDHHSAVFRKTVVCPRYSLLDRESLPP